MDGYAALREILVTMVSGVTTELSCLRREVDAQFKARDIALELLKEQRQDTKHDWFGVVALVVAIVGAATSVIMTIVVLGHK